MGLVACKCPQCGADLEFDESRATMYCQYCGSRVLRTNVIQNITNNYSRTVYADNLNVSNNLEADKMFENWLITKNPKLAQDFEYYYATDPRREYIRAYSLCRWRFGGESDVNIPEERDDCQKLITLAQGLKNQYPMFASLLDKEIAYLRERVNEDQNFLDKEQQEYYHQQAHAAAMRKKYATEDALSCVKGIIVAIVVILLIYLAIANA